MSDCSTHAFDVPLRECPFCKSGAFVRVDITLHPIQSRYRVGCDKDSNCHGWYGHSRYYSTEAEAIAAWNSRAERTCTYAVKDNMNETEGMGDVWFECSACNCKFDYYADEWLMKMSYCPNCGARVVE